MHFGVADSRGFETPRQSQIADNRRRNRTTAMLNQVIRTSEGRRLGRVWSGGAVTGRIVTGCGESGSFTTVTVKPGVVWFASIGSTFTGEGWGASFGVAVNCVQTEEARSASLRFARLAGLEGS